MTTSITSNTTLGPTTATNSGLTLVRASATIGGSTQNLPLHYFTDNDQTPTGGNDNSNNGDANGGINIRQGVTLTLGPGFEGAAGNIKILSGPNTDTDGGRLVMRSSALTLPRLGTVGNIGGTLSFTPQSDTDYRPTLEMYDGALLNMTGTAGDNYRSFLGNHSQGRIICRDSTIRFQNTNASGYAASGGSLSNCFLGHGSRFNNAQIINPNKIELLGAVLEFEDVLIDYQTNGDIVGNSGAIYLAGAANIVASLGAHTLNVPTTLTRYGTNGGNFFKYSSIREAACELSLNGKVRVTTNDDPDGLIPRCNEFFMQSGGGGTQDMNRRYRLNSNINTTVQTLNSSGGVVSGAGDSEAKFAIMDNTDHMQVVVDSDGFTDRSTGNQVVNYYNLPQHGTSNNRNRQRTHYAFPTGKAATAPTFVDGSGHVYWDSDGGTSRANGRILDITSDTSTLTLNTKNVTANARMRQDLRRFYPFRAGFHQWGYYPEFVNTGLGTQAFLGIDGHGVDGTTLNGDNTRTADASPGALRDGVSLSINATQDSLLDGVTRGTAEGRNATITNPTSATGNMTITADAAVSLDHVYQKAQKWTYDWVTNTDSDVYVATDPTATNQDGSGTSRTAAATPGNGDILFKASTDGTGNSVAANAAWSTVNSIVMGGNAGRPFQFTAGTGNDQQHQWLNGYVYFYLGASQWALFSFDRNYSNNYNATTQTLRVSHVASAGNVGSDSSSYRFQRAELRDSMLVQRNNFPRSYLWNPNVALRPMESASNVAIVRNVRLENSTGSDGTHIITPGTLDTVDLSANSVFDCNGKTTALNFTGSGTVTALLTGTTSDCISGDVGSGVTIEFAGGQSYRVNGDISAATLSRTGSGVASIVLGPNGVLPSTLDATQFQTITQLTLTGFADSEVVDVYDFRTGSDSDITTANYTTKRQTSTSLTAATTFGSASGFGTLMTGLGTTIDRVMIVTSARDRVASVQVVSITAGGSNPVTISSTADAGYNNTATLAGTRTTTVLTSGTHSGKMQIATTGTGLGNAPSNRAMLDLRQDQRYRDVMAIHGLTSDFISSEGRNGWSVDLTYAICQTGQVSQYFTGGSLLNESSGANRIFSISTSANLQGGGSVTLVVENRDSPTGISSDAFSSGVSRLEDSINATLETEHNDLLSDITAEFDAAYN